MSFLKASSRTIHGSRFCFVLIVSVFPFSLDQASAHDLQLVYILLGTVELLKIAAVILYPLDSSLHVCPLHGEHGSSVGRACDSW